MNDYDKHECGESEEPATTKQPQAEQEPNHADIHGISAVAIRTFRHHSDGGRGGAYGSTCVREGARTRPKQGK
jgi:hypothetical protein